MPFELALANRGADADGVVVDFDAIKSRDPHDVDHDARPRHAHAEERDERLPAGEDARVRAFLSEHIERLVEAFGAHIVERRGLHGSLRDCRARSGSAPWT